MSDERTIEASRLYLASKDAYWAAYLYDHAVDDEEKAAHLERWRQAVRDMAALEHPADELHHQPQGAHRGTHQDASGQEHAERPVQPGQGLGG